MRHFQNPVKYLRWWSILRILQQNSLIRHSLAYLGTLSFTEPCSDILWDIKAYWSIFKHYRGILRHRHSKLCVILAYTTLPYSEPGTFRTQGISKSVSNMSDDQAHSELWHSQNRLFKHFRGYLGIFGDIDAYSATLKPATRRGGGLPSSFFWK